MKDKKRGIKENAKKILLEQRMIITFFILFALAVFVIPLPQQELVTYTEKVPYQAVVDTVTSENTEQKCVTTLEPVDERKCESKNLSYSASSVECSNFTESRAVYKVHNLADQKGRFFATIGFDLKDGNKRENTYDWVIDAGSTETFTFTINTTNTIGCFFNVERAFSEITCHDKVRYNVDTTCYGGQGDPATTQKVEERFKEVEKQRIETRYRSIIESLLG